MDLAGKVAVISGGTSGIGRAAALMLAARGAKVVVIGRDPKKGAETQAALQRASNGLGVFLKADLSLVSEARRVVAELGGQLQKLDVLIQSAGIIDFEKSSTTEGLDKMFVTNFLHKLVLAEGLEPLLAKATGRMVLVATNADRVRFNWTTLEGTRAYAGVPAMLQLHGASLAMAQRLAQSWRANKIGVTALDPGQVDTGILRSFTGIWKWVGAARTLLLVPVERPAALACWLAFAPEAEGLSGILFTSTKRYDKRRTLSREPQVLDRVFKTAHAVLATA